MSTDNNLMADLLCIADSQWVLGHWYTKNLLNSRNLQDATALAAMSQDVWGHTRALFRWLEEENDLPDFQIEFGRDATQVHNMEVLDKAPQSYGDFILSIFLAEYSVWRLMATLKDGNDPAVASMMTAFGKECYFHRLNIDGWFALLSDAEKQEIIEALPQRLGQAIAWFGTKSASDADPLRISGQRSQAVWDAREQFIAEISKKLANVLDLSEDKIEAMADPVNAAERNNARRRVVESAMPANLWEYVLPSSEDAVKTRRPLSIGIDETIDLFDKPETRSFDYN
ncbi:Phenylacetic acid catabolic protein [Thalassotalea sp. Y01]|uniref:Phenylacetic acid catabolic protein n=1 Tax=Thalassotalea sp. Y01 TaxID=2729613 RepID=UPI00145E874C|nr:Phenylacetic acid catabolic protein [Thalassotalea sp. Y01]NMP14750.1 hypothetical protein [Thalassotalea sp. Y01]